MLRGLTDWIQQTLRIFNCAQMLKNSTFLRSIQEFGQPEDDFVLSQQIFILCYIAAVLWDIQNVPKCIHSLQKLSARHEQLGQAQYLPNILWACIRGIDGNKDLQFQALRLTRVFHRLTDET
jgi:hypothetical protein